MSDCSRQRDARGERLQVVKLPMPGPLYMTAREASGVQRARGAKRRRAGERLAASYRQLLFAERRGRHAVARCA
jgi:agmatine deiminase